MFFYDVYIFFQNILTIILKILLDLKLFKTSDAFYDAFCSADEFLSPHPNQRRV